MNFSERFGIKGEGSAAPKELTYTSKNVRLTVITDRLLRLEVNKNRDFVDKPTQKVWYRSFDNPKVIFSERDGEIVVRTTKAIFHINTKKCVLSSVTMKNGKSVSDFKKGNLKGTARTLDMTKGPTPLDEGLVSTEGVAVLDDSKSLILQPDGTIAPRVTIDKDLYYFAYGEDYRGAIRDFFRLSGQVPLVPRYSLGNWWSRYKAYTQDEYVSLMKRFLKEEIPITVATIDMDWHWVDVVEKFGERAKYSKKVMNIEELYSSQGWTGYSWNTDLFPDYRGMLKWLQEQNFKVTVNVHPAQGVRCFEDMYEDMAKAMGVDPKTEKQIPFDISDPKFISAYFKYLHHPYEKEGVDFWWIDWQQGKKSKIKGLDPLWALNHYHYLDNCRDGKRGMILSRYAKQGSHRYPLGFSGDTQISWPVIKFQPYFTANATNVGYTWWSHDIGGHHFGKRDDELYLRWVQLGVFSPIMRLHSTSNEFLGKEPWKFRWDIYNLSKENLRLRHRLIPYLYTMNYRTHHDGVALVEPMYYSYPQEKAAYNVPNQFTFGSELIVAPITEPVNSKTNLAGVTVWLPKGRYTDIFTGRIYEGGKTVTMYRGIESIPALAKEGTIIPLSANGLTNDSSNPSELDVMIYRGNNTFELYEDDGVSMKFENGEFAFTPLEVSESGKNVGFKILPVKGDVNVVPEKRKYNLQFKDIVKAEKVSVTVNGNPSEYETINGDTLTIAISDILPTDEVIVELEHIEQLRNEDVRESLINLISKFQMDNNKKKNVFTKFIDSPYSMKIPCKEPFKGPIEEILNG